MPATPRYRHPSFWTGRMPRLFLLAFVALAVLRISWGRSAAARVEAQWAEARQRGEWTTPADFNTAPIPAGQNAWTFQTRAAQAIAPDIYCPRNSNMEYTDYPPYGPLWMKAAENSEAANAAVFQLAQQARAIPRTQLRAKADFSFDGYFPKWLNEARNLANVLCDSAQLAEVKGNHLQAVERLRDSFRLGQSTRTDPTLVSQLVAIGVDALTCNSICITAPGLNLRSDSSQTPALRRAVSSLIAELLDESEDQSLFVKSLMGERIFAAKFLEAIAADRWVITPLAQADIARGNLSTAFMIQAARQPDMDSAQRVIAQHIPRRRTYADETLTAWYGDQAPSRDYSNWFIDVYYYTDRMFQKRFQAISERRLAATSLAMQLFRADHSRWPHKLDELIPTYLPAIPKDPFRADGGPIAYSILRKALPDGSDRPLLSYELTSIDTQDARQWSEPIYGYQDGVSAAGRPMGDVRQYRDVTRFRPASVTIKEIDGNSPLPDPAPETPGALPPGTEPDPDNPCTPRERKKEEPKSDSPEKK